MSMHLAMQCFRKKSSRLLQVKSNMHCYTSFVPYQLHSSNLLSSLLSLPLSSFLHPSFFSTSFSPHPSLCTILSMSLASYHPHLSSFSPLSSSLHLSMSVLSITHLPSFSLLAYAVNQNRFPLGTALNIILNFSLLISAASFTLNLLPRAIKQHGIHETCTHHRECDYSSSISLSILLFHHPKQHRNRETCSHLRQYLFFFLVFLLSHPIPTCFPSPFQSLLFHFSL